MDGLKQERQSLLINFISEKLLSASAECAGRSSIKSINFSLLSNLFRRLLYAGNVSPLSYPDYRVILSIRIPPSRI